MISDETSLRILAKLPADPASRTITRVHCDCSDVRKINTAEYFMPMWDLEGELLRLNAMLPQRFNEQDVRSLFELWGGSPR